MRVLGIETSCDETGLAIYDEQAGLLGHVLHSQVDLHAEWGGVVPELASRDHVIRLIPLLKQVLAQSPSPQDPAPSPPRGEGWGGGQIPRNSPLPLTPSPEGRGNNPTRSENNPSGSEDNLQGSGESIQGSGENLQESGGNLRGSGENLQGSGENVRGSGGNVQQQGKNPSGKADKPWPPVDAIAYTAGPGLAGALLTGAAFARSLAWTWGIPAIPVHHMEGHLLAPMLENDAPDYPFLALLVSGGHTLLVHVRNLGQYEILGETRDDAVGEAFDKTAKLLGLGYPGGAALAQLAQTGRPDVYQFPRPMTDRPGLEFSFSGLKTAVLKAVERVADDAQAHADIARGFEDAVIDTLAIKCGRAIAQTQLSSLVVAGGVSANIRLRQRLQRDCEAAGVRVYYPRPEFCTDNGAMIAYAGLQRLHGVAGAGGPAVFEARPRWPIDQLTGVVETK